MRFILLPLNRYGIKFICNQLDMLLSFRKILWTLNTLYLFHIISCLTEKFLNFIAVYGIMTNNSIHNFNFKECWLNQENYFHCFSALSKERKSMNWLFLQRKFAFGILFTFQHSLNVNIFQIRVAIATYPTSAISHCSSISMITPFVFI